jgi:RimJ/RimL family protein N-acetyltransferase
VIIIGQDQRVGDFVVKRTGGERYHEGVAFGVERDGELVGGILVDSFNGASACLHIAGSGKYWMPRDFLPCVFTYCFVQCGLNVVIGIMSSWNTQAIRFARNVGFVEKYRIPDAVPNGDMVILTMTREQCRWIKGSEDEKGIESAAAA